VQHTNQILGTDKSGKPAKMGLEEQDRVLELNPFARRAPLHHKHIRRVKRSANEASVRSRV